MYVRKAKYSNVKTPVGDYVFDSKREAKRYSELLILQRAGAISGLELQPVYRFSINGKPVLIRSDGYPNGRQVRYVADFKYIDTRTGKVKWEDSKGMRTPEFILKKAFLQAISPEIDLVEI